MKKAFTQIKKRNLDDVSHNQQKVKIKNISNP